MSFASAGTYTVTFNYTSGNHRLDIKGVDVLTYGNKVIASDYHAGYTGTYQSDKVYTLVIPSKGHYKVRYYITQPNNFSSNGNIVWSPEVTSTEETVDATGKFTTWTYHTASNGGWYGKCASNTTPSVVIEQDGTADVVGWSTSNSVKRPWIKAGYTYNITPALPDGKVITGYTLTTQSTSGSYSGTYTYTTNTGTATSAAQAVNTDKTVSVSGLSTDKITITVNGSAGANNYGILITGLTITYDDTAARMYKLKHNNSSLYLSLNETDGFNGSDNSKNAATFATTGTDFLISESGDNYVFKTASGKTLCAAADGKHWNFSNTTEGASNTTWKLTEVDGGVTIQTVSGNAANKYVGADNYAEGQFIFTNKQTQDVWTLEIVATITFQYVYDGNVVKTIEKGYGINGTYDAPDITGYNITATSGTVTGNATVEVPCTPVIPYKNVYLANDNDQKLQFSIENGALKVATTDDKLAEKYIWKVAITQDGYYTFQNLATGKYLRHKGIQDAPYNFELRNGFVSGQYSLFSVADNKYFVIKYDGTLDQADGTYNKTNTNFSTDFIFEEAVINTLTINTNPAVAGVFTWNGETKRGSTVIFNKIAGIEVSGDATAIQAFDNGYNATLSATEWNGESNLTVTATMTPSFFSTDIENAKWVRINNVRNGNYYIYADDKEALHSHQPSATANELFALVGNANSFKLYSKTKQAYYGAANNDQDSPVVAGGANNTYKLVVKTGDYAGYAIVPTGNEGQSLNMHGGAGHDIKYYSAGDDGATWNVVKVVATNMTINIEGETSPLNQLVGSFSYTADGVVSGVNVTYESLGKETVIYLPKAKSLVVNESSLKTYKGYEVKSAEFTNNSIAITYTATDARWLFQTYGKGRPYRIPSIAKAKNNDLIAISDDRFCGNDIGYGKVNIVYKVSHDNGKTWSEETMLAEGDGIDNSSTCGFGDAATVADRTSDKVMVMCVSAPKDGTCWTAAQRSSILWGEPNGDGTWTWTTPIDIKDEIMALLPSDRVNYFVGSGKLHQSRYIKVGDYYRVYAALWTSNGNRSNLDNYVVYSDNFGAAGSWKLLGTADVCPGPNGNEPKCEELPNGDVLLSARQPYHRLHNIFHYTNAETGEGSWGTSATGINNNDGPNGTDGEILIIEAKNKETGNKEWIGLQSAPNNGRANVSMWYKVLGSADDNTKYSTPAEFGKGWTLSKQFADYSSCYTTMCLQADKRIAFFYEDGQSGAEYDMVYMPLTLESVTENKYEFIGTEKDTEESTPETTVVIGDITSADDVAEVVDATASSVDMTQATVDAEISDEFVETIVAKTGNKNTLVYVPASANVSAAKNVIVKDGSKYTCQSLVLTDKMPFSAPNEFTASNAVYTRTMANKWGTICLPYAVRSNENEAYYTIDRIEDGKLIINQVEGLEAGQPGLVQKFAGDGIAPAATSVEVVGSKNDETLVDGTVTMIGSFANDTEVRDENAFYIKDNKFWQRAEASEQIADPFFYIDAFRAYFKVEPAANQSRIMSIVVNGDEATGIDALEIAEALSGKEGKFLQNGRVVIVKDNRQYTTAGQRLK